MEELNFDKLYASIGAPNSLSIEQRERLMEGYVKYRNMSKEDHRRFYEHCSRRNRQALAILSGEGREKDYPERWAESLERIRLVQSKKAEYEELYRDLIKFTDEKEAEFRE